MNKKLIQKLKMMAANDQKARRKAMENNDWKAVKKNDRQNTARLKKIIKKIDWPMISMAGKTGSRNAWLITQHADHDLKFQKTALTIIEKIYKENPKEIDSSNIAYLKDRVFMNQNKKQLFGTQFYYDKKTGKPKPWPIQKIKTLDLRRKKYGLAPFKNFLKKIKIK